jgi:hypothetical protein
MRCKMLFVVAGLLFVCTSLSGARAEVAPITTAISGHVATPGAKSVMPVRWLCAGQPGSGLGRQCRWVSPGWRWEQCWIERIPGSELGPHRVCRY